MREQILYWVAVAIYTGIWFPFALALIATAIGMWILQGAPSR